MGAQHTPGPWFAADLRTQGANRKMDGCDIGAANGANVALALHQASDRESNETIANARLIAAGPELLAAAQLYIDTIEAVENRCMAVDGPVTPTHKEITDDELRAVYIAARDAIAKATRSPA
jgi:hypothetical protein